MAKKSNRFRILFIVNALLLILFLLSLLFGCSKEQTTPLGFGSFQELAQGYVDAVKVPEPAKLEKLFIGPADIENLPLRVKLQIKEDRWMAFYQLSKKVFMEDNKDILGQDVSLIAFKEGEKRKFGKTEIIYDNFIQIGLPGGLQKNVKIPQVVSKNGRYKIFTLRDLKSLKAAKEKSEETAEKGKFGDFNLEKGPDVIFKVKKIDGNEKKNQGSNPNAPQSGGPQKK